MPIQDDFVDRDEFDQRKPRGTPLKKMPLWRNEWKARRTGKFRRCSSTNRLIWPFQEAYAQDTFWGLSNAETHDEIETEWLSPAAYTYRKLANG